MTRDELDVAGRRVIWAAVGIACTAPIVWLWATWVARNDARLVQHIERQAVIAQCRDEQAIAVHILNSDTVACVSGSGRKLFAPLAHPLRGKQ